MMDGVDEKSQRATNLGTVLVVDDDLLNRDLLTNRLRKAGYKVEAAENGLRALEILSWGGIDVILLDLLMPEMSGYEVLERLKQDSVLRHIPVIVVSAMDELDAAVCCIEMGAADHLVKPVNAVLLRARVNASLAAKRYHDREMDLHRELKTSFAKLQQLEQMRDDLTHMIVHDLRAPLSSMLFGLQALELQGSVNPAQKQILDVAVVGGRSLLTMINNMLDVSKMEQGSLQLERQSVAMDSLVKRAVGQLESTARRAGVELACEVEKELPPLDADEEKLDRLLVNLLSNAVKFTPAKGTVTLRAHRREDGRELLLEVSDTGEGIPEEEFTHIFEKFGQVEGRQRGRGMSTGLGLTFCKMVAEAHGGRIWVASQPGQGSTFSVALPMLHEAPP